MNLSELAPQTVDFTLLGVELTFRPFTIADDLHNEQICGSRENVFKAFKEFDFKQVSLLAWHQLTLESQRRVLEVVETSRINPETGEEEPVNTKPIDKFRHLFQGIKDQIELLTNSLKCKGINIPDIENEEALKKWLDQFGILPTGR